MLNKPVEVWCVINPTGKGPDIVGIGFDEIDAWIDFGIENPTQGEEYQGRGYRCERRLLMHEGETFADGVEAAINHLALSGVIKIDGVFAKELRALSPAPSEADKLLREARDLIASGINIDMERSARTITQQFVDRIDTYLKERG